jgi:hypothetical protein
MARLKNPAIFKIMNPCCQIATNPVTTASFPTRWSFTRLKRLVAGARFTSVDLTDTIFASAPDRTAPVEAKADPLSLADRPKEARFMPWRFI